MLICKYIRIVIFNSTDLVNKIRKGKKIWLKKKKIGRNPKCDRD